MRGHSKLSNIQLLGALVINLRPPHGLGGPNGGRRRFSMPAGLLQVFPIWLEPLWPSARSIVDEVTTLNTLIRFCVFPYQSDWLGHFPDRSRVGWLFPANLIGC